MLSVSVKGVVYNNAGGVLLALNDRAEWELPGGRMESGESEQECLVREVLEETGLAVSVHRHLGRWLFEVIPGAEVLISAYQCHPSAHTEAVPSIEHDEVRFWPGDALPDLALPEVYRQAISMCGSD